MATLDRWTPLLQIPLVLPFPKLQLIRFDNGPPLLHGCGEVKITSPSQFEFELRGEAANPGYLKEQLLEQQASPYESFSRCRLFGTDDSGMEWAFGWTIPIVRQNGSEWICVGELAGLTPYGERESEQQTTELLFAIPRSHPLVSLIRWDAREGWDDRVLHLRKPFLDSDITLRYDFDAEILSITALHSAMLPPTYTERWLVEPLCIMTGQLISPRLMARNLDGKDAHICLTRAHRVMSEPTWAALLQHRPFADSIEGFWEPYSKLLSYVAASRDASGRPYFEANPLTRIYEEVILAISGSRWVWALTLASSIESLTVKLGGVGLPRSGPEINDAEELLNYINAYPDADRLKTRVVDFVRRTMTTTVTDALRALVQNGTLAKKQYEAWSEIRNSAMHGKLLSPYSTQSEDAKITALIEMLHRLTIKVLEQTD